MRAPWVRRGNMLVQARRAPPPRVTRELPKRVCDLHATLFNLLVLWEALVSGNANPNSPANDAEPIDMDSYRVQKRTTQKILLPDKEGEIGPVPPPRSSGRPTTELHPISEILRDFNDPFAGIAWEDANRIRSPITEPIRSRVAHDEAYRNARENSDKEITRVEHDRTLVDRIVLKTNPNTSFTILKRHGKLPPVRYSKYLRIF